MTRPARSTLPVWHLRRWVAQVCGPADRFAAIGSDMAEWVDSGGGPPAARDLVEPRVAGYLARAEAAGRRWGFVVGLFVGVLLGTLTAVVTLLLR